MILAVLAVFARTVGFSYIGLDDAGYTFRNPFVATGLSLPNIIESFTNFRHGGIWMPFTYISYMIDMDVSRLTGISLSVWMHLVSVVFHALNTVLLLLLARRLSGIVGTGGPSILMFLAVGFWAVHPMRVEPVAWIACRKELFWVFFTLAGLLSWIKSLTSAGAGAVRRHLVLTFLFCVMACLSKPSAMCFPVLAGAIHLLLRFRSEPAGGTADVPRSRIACYAAMLAVAAGTAFAASYSQTHVAGQEAVALFAAPLHHRVVHALSALGFYLRAAVWPSGLHIDFRMVDGIMPLGGVSNLVFLGIVALAVLALTFTSWRKRSGATAACLFSFAWFMVPVFPTLGILGSFGIEAHADRFTYLPAMAVVFFAALAPVPEGLSRRTAGLNFRKAAWAVVVAYGVFAFRQTGFWKDDYTAHLRALECDPGHPRAMVQVGDALCARFRKFDRGIELYRKSYALRPREYVKYRLAYALASRGNRDDYLEVKKLGAAVVKDTSLDGRGMMLDALGTAYMAEGDWETAIKMFKASIDAPGRFWPKASTKHKLDQCIERIR